MERILFTNYNLYERFNEAKKFLKEEYEEFDPSDSQVWDLLYDDSDIEWQNTKDEIDRYFNNKVCILVGSVGRWNGTYAGGEVGTAWDLIEDFITDCEYVKIIDNNGHFNIECSHHDGTNYGELKILTKTGEDYLNRWEENYDDNRTEAQVHSQIMNRYSVLPHFAKKIYG